MKPLRSITGINTNRIGAAACVASMACYVINDIIIKLFAASLPLGELIFLRGLVATALILGFTRARVPHRPVRRMVAPRVMVLAIANLFMAFLYLAALLNMSIADVTAIMQIGPLVLTMSAGLVLKERVGARRWLAVGIGFIGVLLIVKPAAASFNVYALSILAAVAVSSLRDLVLRVADYSAVPSALITQASIVMITAGGGVLALFETWAPIDLRTFLLIALSSVFLIMALQFLIVSTRTGELSAVVPFRFSIIPLAVLGGYLVWGELPDLLSLAGIALILCTGLYTLRREKVREVVVATKTPGSRY